MGTTPAPLDVAARDARDGAAGRPRTRPTMAQARHGTSGGRLGQRKPTAATFPRRGAVV